MINHKAIFWRDVNDGTVDASDLGLAVGEWPNELRIAHPDGTTVSVYRHSHSKSALTDQELVAYKSLDGQRRLVVFND